MTIDERIEKNERHIAQLAVLMQQSIEQANKDRAETREDLKRMANALESLIELNANQETRIGRIEERIDTQGN